MPYLPSPLFVFVLKCIEYNIKLKKTPINAYLFSIILTADEKLAQSINQQMRIDE